MSEEGLAPVGAWGRFKRKLKRCLPMPHRTAMRKFDEVLAMLNAATQSPGGLSGREFRDVNRKFEMLQLQFDGMQKGFAAWGPTQAADWRCCGIEKIEIFFVRVDVPRNFSGGVWPWRYQCMFKISGGGKAGWSELTVPDPENICCKLTEISRKFCGKSLGWGMELCRALRGVVPDGIIESLEMAMLDLAARVSGRDILDFLGLPHFDSVPYLECVLQKDPAKAEEHARMLARKYLKIKLFGDIELDTDIVARVRRVIPADCYLTADVNLGYCSGDADRALPSEARLEKVAGEMRKLQAAGLNACEDPAPFTLEEMQKLQGLLTGMPIIPDAPMRPGYRICRNFKAVPGQIYNLHPHCMGSVKAALKLAEDIRASQGGVMIGDNSLIGVGCIQWQVIAGGCRADWCEAVEKSLEGSDKFAECLLKSPVRKCDDGFCRYVGSDEPGFGIVINDEKLKAMSDNHIVVTEEI